VNNETFIKVMMCGIIMFGCIILIIDKINRFRH
jgi:hypothetical protein